MNGTRPGPLEQLEAASETVERLAAEVGDRASSSPDSDVDARIGLVQQRLKVALDELGGVAPSVLDVNDS